jgi:hypothetical protein
MGKKQDEANKAIRTRSCSTCLQPFSYEISRGTDRKYCSSSCRVSAQMRARAERRDGATEPCHTVGCSGKVILRSGVCEACYRYKWRTGKDRDLSKPRYKLRNAGNYLAIRVPGHPLASQEGDVYQHRLVAYKSLNGVCGGCHWCGIPLVWVNAVVDHLNEDKTDNRPENLVVSCNECNRSRGSILTFLWRLQPERFEQLVEVFRAQVGRRRERQSA